MHIPDGYLSPQTCAALGAAMVPVWYTASRKLSAAMRSRQVPLVAAAAAFAFVIQMFNIPIPDGTSAHAVGATLVAIVVGPWGAVTALTVTLAIQAIFFGDGGVLAFGANAFNLAFVAPVVGYSIYRLLARGSDPASSRRWIAAGAAGFVSTTVAALLAGVQFGLQPLLFSAPDGTPLYSPYGFGQAIPAMVFAHLLFAGPAEAMVTALAVKYLQRTNPALLEWREQPRLTASVVALPRARRRAWPVLAILAILSPIGLLATGAAWGEWASVELERTLGYIPVGMQSLAGLWGGFMPDYALPGLGTGWLTVFGYVLSAAVGMVAIAIAITLLGRLLAPRTVSQRD